MAFMPLEHLVTFNSVYFKTGYANNDGKTVPFSPGNVNYTGGKADIPKTVKFW